MNVKIMVAAHKKYVMPSDMGLYLPIQVGAARTDQRFGFQTDNSGINISNKNANYNELTAQYWAWRNLKDTDAVGLFHYRRYLTSRVLPTHSLNKVLTKAEVLQALTEAPIILPKKRNYIIETNENHYRHAHPVEPLKVLSQIIAAEYGSYDSAFHNVLQRHSAHMFNMFIMKSNLFDEYSSWLFSVLGRVEESIDISQYSVFEQRVFGFLSELLLDTWIETKKYRYKEFPILMVEREHLVKKGLEMIKRKALGDKGEYFKNS
ncbi:DUF4422 domain-containing protein [Lacticaseibacillus paracasei]|uniref:DUF4422 domain-containing protein n=1 Tax=Lacticaseibacillus paracasei TaxID=1597 RepID=UPI0021A62837|nr:DUF4422 domain-containing protein [Lacticaseibacillus paracasei]MCT4384173.1 DUF4422 domain-containing protein [Lacticaseibacillus paracasei]